jgi:ribose 5-phosphate isomerase A
MAMNPKQRAARAALPHLRSGMVVGLGTGSTADYFLQALSWSMESGKLRDIRGVPTSKISEQRAQYLGIPLVTLEECPEPDVTVDGADEIAPNLDLIKGLGGALLREKIVAQASKRLIVIADSSKTVPYLGAHFPLPVEVTPFAHRCCQTYLNSLGATATLRMVDGAIFVTDNGNYIYDCKFDRIDDPHGLERALRQHAGIVESGLFLGMADLALVANDRTVDEIVRNAPAKAPKAAAAGTTAAPTASRG